MADVRYQMPWWSGVVDEEVSRLAVERQLEDALRGAASEDRDRGFTTVGPHRDDLDTSLNSYDVKTFASQGQNRAFVLAMKIAEIRYLEDRYRFVPILLLDDVSSELDRDRNRYLFDFLKSRGEGQVFITTTHRDYILLDEEVSTFEVSNGEIRASG